MSSSPACVMIRAIKEAGLEIKDRKYHLKNYPLCFLGSDLVSLLIQIKEAHDVDSAVVIGRQLMAQHEMYHVTRDESFKNGHYYYRFTADGDHGASAMNESGAALSWNSIVKVMPGMGKSTKAKNTSFDVRDNRDTTPRELLTLESELTEIAQLSPLDKHNLKLLDAVHPPNWQNPTLTTDYTLVVIGAGAGGLVTAAGSAGVGTKVAIIEKQFMGGDCLNTGCVPSKALIRAAREMKIDAVSQKYGLTLTSSPVKDFSKAMERLRKIRSEIARVDSCQRFSAELGVDVYQGSAMFISPTTVQITSRNQSPQVLTFKKAVIASGASTAIPNIPGLKEVPYLTNASVFNLTELPPRVCVIGAGPIGVELAQAFARFGSKVTVFIRGGQLLPKEDRDAAALVEAALLDDNITLKYHTTIDRMSATTAGHKFETPFNVNTVHVTLGKTSANSPVAFTMECEMLLIATGRAPNVSGLGLEAANVKFRSKVGVVVSDTLQTSNPNIYAVGDVCTKFQFTHMADFMARKVIRNALFFGNEKVSSLLVPWATFTEPEVAHVGLYPRDMEADNIPFDTYTKHFKDNDRAICDGETVGFVKVHVKAGGDEIIGATIVNAHAGDMISELTLAMQMNIGLGKLANVIHPYPSQQDAIRACGDLYNKTKLTPKIKGVLSRIANRSLT